jgi:hypothetical protein
MQEYHPRMEMMQATLTGLQGEQRKLYKVFKAWNSRLKDMEQMVAAVPSIRTEQAGTHLKCWPNFCNQKIWRRSNVRSTFQPIGNIVRQRLH